MFTNYASTVPPLPTFDSVADIRTVLQTTDWPVHNVQGYGAVADGVTDDGPAFNRALAAVDALGGGVVTVPPGTYRITTQVVVPGSNITIRGAGIGRTILTDGASFATGIIHAVGRSNITIRDLTLQPQATYSSYGFYVEGGAALVTDILIEDVRVEQLKASGSGAIVTGGAGGMQRVTVRGLVVTSPAGGTGTVGFSLGGGDNGTFSREALLENCVFDGFNDAFRQNTPGVWQDGLKVTNCVFKNARRHGAYMYHCGRSQITNCAFSGNDAGLFLTDGALNQGGRVANCRFHGNTTLGMWSESLGYGGISGCSFDANGYGLWITAGLEWAITGCTMTNNTRDGVLVDRHAAILSIADGGYTYTPVTVDGVQSVDVSGCVVASNSRNGISIKGVQKSFRLVGCQVINNGQADNPTPTNYSDLTLDADTDGANNYSVEIAACTIGNAGGTGTYTGYTKWGIKSAAGTLSYLDVVGCRFEVLDTPISVPTAVSLAVTGCTFVGCANNLALVAGAAWRANTITGGALAQQLESIGAGLSLTGLLTMLTAAAKVVAGATSLAFWNAANTFANLTILDAGAVTIHRGKLTVTTGGIEATAGDITAVAGAVQEKRGANATAANNLVLTRDGNCWQISGATQINLLDTTGWQDGAVVRLVFLGAPTVKHNQALSGTNAPILLAGGVDFVASANDTLTLMRIGNSWYECSRAVI